ncbi:hypothetical protein SME10J_23770 [Serratia marcescens]|nr:hypothetical protein SME10J_23770 [Serratia marcescens]
MNEKSKVAQNTESDSLKRSEDEYPTEQEMKDKFKAGAVPLASDFEILIKLLYAAAEASMVINRK